MARDVVLTFGGRLAVTAAIIVGDVIVARTLGPEGKGGFTLLLALSSLGAVFLSLGLDRSLAVFAARSLDVARRAFANAVLWTVLIGAAGTLAIIALYGPIAGGRGGTGPLAGIMPALTLGELALAALALPFEMAYAIGLVGLLGRQGVISYNVLRFVRRAILTALLLGFALAASIDLELVLWLNLAALALTAGGILLAAARAGILSLHVSPSMLVGQLSFGGRAVVGTIAERLHYRANTFMLTALVSVAATGVFSVALALAETLWYLPGALGLVLFSRAVRPDTDSAAIASAMTRTMLALMVVAAAPLALVAPALIEIVYGAPFREAGPALQILLPGVVLYSIVALLSHYVIARGAPGRAAAVLIAGLGINIAGNVLLIPQLGLIGAALASTVSYSATAVLMLLLYRNISGQGLAETLIIRRSDISARWTQLRELTRRALPGRA